MDQQPGPTPEPTGEVLRRLAADVAALLRLYGRALQDHSRGLVRDVAVAAALIGAALVLGVFALGLIVATLVLVLAVWMPAWAAALVVLGATGGIAVLIVVVGIGRVRRRRAAWAARVAEEVRWLRSLFPTES
jgi:hypothetical protein